MGKMTEAEWEMFDKIGAFHLHVAMSAQQCKLSGARFIKYCRDTLQNSSSNSESFRKMIGDALSEARKAYNSHICMGSDQLALRQQFAEAVHSTSENGLVGVIQSGMDCDCVRYCHPHIMTAAPFEITRFIDECSEWADGPMSFDIVPPSELPDSHQRDLALEAFEDGHPHVVYT